MSDLEHLHTLEAAATPGPWHADPKHGSVFVRLQDQPQKWSEADIERFQDPEVDDEEAIFEDKHAPAVDVEFIVALRNSAAWLIERARRADELEAEVERLEDLYEGEAQTALGRQRQQIVELRGALSALMPAHPFQEDYDALRGERMGSYCISCRSSSNHTASCAYAGAARLLEGEKE